MSLCPCESQQTYESCCLPIHQHHQNAHTPEQLMRARYSAHVKGLVDFVVATYHPSCEAEKERDAIADSIASDWCGLEVVSTAPGEHHDEGFVTFKAYFSAEQGRSTQTLCLEERSRFVRENGLWYYIDGEFPQANQAKVGRNDPCPCQSGNKFKKCCG